LFPERNSEFSVEEMQWRVNGHYTRSQFCTMSSLGGIQIPFEKNTDSSSEIVSVVQSCLFFKALQDGFKI
jgi:hypothetical protein